MLKEACAVSALVAATLVPSAAAQAQAGKVSTVSTPTTSASLGKCASAHKPKCEWWEQADQRCLYCPRKKGGWKQQYCERKAREPEGPMELECATAPAPTATNPKRVCETCVDQKGRQVSKKCFTGP